MGARHGRCWPTAECDVLKGQCIRSNAGLYYETFGEFVETLRAIEQNRWLAGALGRNGRQFFRDHYDWPVIERKYLDMFARLVEGAAGPTDRAAARLARSAAPGRVRRPKTCSRRCRRAPSLEDGRDRPRAPRTARRRVSRDPPGPRHARLRRRDRPRGARHPARAARGRATSRRSSSRRPTTGSSR